MTTTFLSEGVWAELTEAVSNSKRQCFAAVAYFAKGASSQLPLPKESLLVVNASDSMVAAGVTCPDELIKFASLLSGYKSNRFNWLQISLKSLSQPIS